MAGFAARNELITTSDCMCPGQTIIYEYSIVGGVFTVWSGTIMEPGCEITLRHIDFPFERGICNNGAVIGQGVEVNNNCYTSQLTIFLTPDLDQRTVQCSVDTGASVTVMGVAQLLLTTGIICISTQ